ncbi:MAG TPA: hypothetical protein VNW04_00930 [Puia sp.]|nr:hypothetical protein [Puia sp.]
MKTLHSTPANDKYILTSKPGRTFKYVKLFLLGLIIAAGLSSCVVYAHPYHHHYYYYH